MGTVLQTSPRYLTVTELNQMLNGALERAAPYLYFEGEVSEVKKASSGHLYLTIKDASSQTNAVIWRGVGETLTFPVTQGLSVVCEGKPNIWHVTGRLQIVIHKIQPAGEGLLRKKFLELKAKLDAEGLFSEARKRPLPFLPRAIGIVTSAKGAAIHDMMVKLRERMPQVPVYLCDVRVQGAGSAEEIAEGIKEFGRSELVDVLIVGRGGGSLEDLWSFNEEVVVRAIFASPIPVISAVGHEVDVSLSDLVADLRAPTPTAAAEIVVPRRSDLLEDLRDQERRLFDLSRSITPLAQRVDDGELRLHAAVAGLKERWVLTVTAAESHLRALEPRNVLAMLGSREERLRGQLLSAVQRVLQNYRSSVEGLRLDRIMVRLERLMVDRSNRLIAADRSLREHARRTLERRGAAVASLGARLTALNPQKTLERGYSVIQHRGVVVTNASEVSLDAELNVRLAHGSLTAKVVTPVSKETE